MKSIICSMGAAVMAIGAATAVQAAGSGASADSSAQTKQIEESCIKAAKGIMRKPKVFVDTDGSDSYSMAIMVGRSVEEKTRAAIICVVDKRTGAAELGSPFTKDELRVFGPKVENKKQEATDDAADSADDMDSSADTKE